MNITKLLILKSETMKKFLSFFCYVAMAIAAVSFVSCGDDDDNDDPKKEPTPEAQKVQIYAATIGDQALDLFNIKLNMYRNGQKQVVVLDKSMIAKTASTANTDFQSYYCSSVNGVEGIDSVVAEVELKPNVDEYIARQDPNGRCTWLCTGDLKVVNKAANGDYSSYCIQPSQTLTATWSMMLKDHKDTIYYLSLPSSLVTFMSDKYVN